jgi:putative ABC transport system permease protein
VDLDLIETFDIELVDGRNFSKSQATDEKSAFILNASAVEQFGWASAIGKQMAWKRDLNEKKTVIGVIRDFHFRSLHERIEPLILQLRGSTFRIMYVKLRSENIEESLTLIRNTWKTIFPHRPFEFFFLEDDIDAMYKSEQKMGQLFRYASLLAVFIACLGLFGLVSFATEQRTKEIGIRKAIGATVTNIVLLLSREFLKWIVVANVIAWPVAYFIMDAWLRDFAYRAKMSVWLFVLSTVLAFVIALVTVSTQTVKAALANPIKTLRYE